MVAVISPGSRHSNRWPGTPECVYAVRPRHMAAGMFRISGPVRQTGVSASALLLWLIAAAAPAGEAVPLFTEDTLLPVRIEAPLRRLTRERSDTEYLDGFLYYTDGDGLERAFDLKLRARGRYRRKPDTCSFPPVRLNFRKDQVDGTSFAGIDKLKLVTHCKDSSSYEQNVLEEYLAYRILNTLTDESFRVRLLHVDWVDNERGDETGKRYAFLIEDDDLLEDRLGAERAEVRSVGYDLLQPEPAALVSVFQYLIGNTDFSMVLGPQDDDCCHNAVLFAGDHGRYLPIPYDFDFAGLVNARYAEPNPRLKIRRVTSRLYRGNCIHNEYLDGALEQVMAQRGPVMALLDSVPGMDDRTRETARRYLGDVYDDLSAPDGAERYLIKNCT